MMRAILLVMLGAVVWPADTIQYAYDDAGRLIRADYGGGRVITYRYDRNGSLTGREVAGQAGFASVSSASFAAGTPLAPESIAAGFGSGLATGLAVATETPLPTELLGTRVEVRDSQGTTRRAPLFFVSPSQINYLVPAGTASGRAAVTVTSGAGGTITGTLDIDSVAPALYTANEQGSGAAAGFFLRVADDGSRDRGPVFEAATRAAVPIDLGAGLDQVYLELFGTGLRGFTSAPTATVGGETVQVIGPAPHPEYVGLDQVNLGPLPRTLAGRGEVQVSLSIDNKRANTITVAIQ